ncbi:MAG: GAF domain-containing protein, partial [Actinobacteria bacterium]|nr:GAF domain-containing protein [Actinomycetota bacterium]
MRRDRGGTLEPGSVVGASREVRAPQWRRLLVLRVVAIVAAVGLSLWLFPDDDRKWLFALIVGGIYLPVSVVIHLLHDENPRPPSPGWAITLGNDVAVVGLVMALFPTISVVALFGLALIVIVNAQFFGARWGMVVAVVAWAGLAAPTLFGSPGRPGAFEAVFGGPMLIAVGFVVGTLADDERRAAGRSRRLADAIASVGSSLELGEVLSGLCRAACGALDGRFAVVLSREHGSLSFAAGTDGAELSMPPGEGESILSALERDPELAGAPTPRALATGEPVYVDDIEREGSVTPFEALVRGMGVRSLAAVPILREGRAVAVLNVYLPRAHRYTGDEREFLSAIAEHAAIAMERATLFARERETAGRLRELDRLKSDFVATVSHELRTPLTGIVGFALTLRNRWRDLEGGLRDELLERVEENARSLEHLITHLLDFSRLERGQFRVTIGAHDAPLLVHRVLQNMAHELGPRPVRVSAEEGLRVLTDPYAFERILGNLLSNAAKFSPGGESVLIRARRQDLAIRVSVADRGPGIPAEFQRRIFGK